MEKHKIKATLSDPQVVALVEELSVVMRRHEDDIARLMAALLITAASACKSFGLHPAEFLRNFELTYGATTSVGATPFVPEPD